MRTTKLYTEYIFYVHTIHPLRKTAHVEVVIHQRRAILSKLWSWMPTIPDTLIQTTLDDTLAVSMPSLSKPAQAKNAEHHCMLTSIASSSPLCLQYTPWGSHPCYENQCVQTRKDRHEENTIMNRTDGAPVKSRVISARAQCHNITVAYTPPLRQHSTINLLLRSHVFYPHLAEPAEDRWSNAEHRIVM